LSIPIRRTLRRRELVEVERLKTDARVVIVRRTIEPEHNLRARRNRARSCLRRPPVRLHPPARPRNDPGTEGPFRISRAPLEHLERLTLDRINIDPRCTRIVERENLPTFRLLQEIELRRRLPEVLVDVLRLRRERALSHRIFGRIPRVRRLDRTTRHTRKTLALLLREIVAAVRRHPKARL